MSVCVNVIKPQGLEPLQFPTNFRSPSGVVALDVEIRDLTCYEAAYGLGGARPNRGAMTPVRFSLSRDGQRSLMIEARL